MKIRAKATGEVIDVEPEAATLLIDAGIYDAVDETPGTSTTAVAPMTTGSLPVRTKKVR